MSTVIKPLYGASSAITISLASLASSSSFVAGHESDVVTNTSNRYDDALLAGKIRVGTTPTINTQILVYVWGVLNDTPTYPDVFDGTDSDETLTSVGVGRGFLKLSAVLDVDATTSDRDYPFGPVSVAQLFGGHLPTHWGLFVTHNTGVNLNSTSGNHVIKYTPVQYESV